MKNKNFLNKFVCRNKICYLSMYHSTKYKSPINILNGNSSHTNSFTSAEVNLETMKQKTSHILSTAKAIYNTYVHKF